MAFLGRHTERRARAIAHCAPVLARRRSAIYLTETVQPHRAGSTYFLAGERRAQLLAGSRAVLNVHQQELAYMEWHRVLSATLNGCVVVSEDHDTGDGSWLGVAVDAPTVEDAIEGLIDLHFARVSGPATASSAARALVTRQTAERRSLTPHTT